MRVVGILSGYACLGLSFLIVAEILGRKFLNVSIQGVDEIGGYVVAITSAFGMALTTFDRGHTRIDVLLSRLPMRLRVLLNVLAYLALAAASAFIAYMAWSTLSDSLRFGAVSPTPLQTPLWLPQSLWVAGFTLFCLTAIWMALHGVMALRQGLVAAERALAPPTVAEEVEEATW